MEKNDYLCIVASVKKHSHLDNIHGRYGKVIVSSNPYGSIAYEKPEYVHKSTNAQVKTQLSHKQVIRLWQTFSPDDILKFDKIAGDPGVKRMCLPSKIASGYSLFYYLNRNLQEIGESLITTVPLLDIGARFIMDFRVEKVKFRGKEGLKLYTVSEIDENIKLIVYATHSVAGGIGRPNNSWFRKICVLDNRFKAGDYITAYYLKVFEAIDTTKMSIFFRFKTVDRLTGLASNPKISVFTLILKEKS